MAHNTEETTSTTATDRRAMLKKVGRFAAITAPAVTLMLAAQTKPARAAPPSGVS